MTITTMSTRRSQSRRWFPHVNMCIFDRPRFIMQPSILDCGASYSNKCAKYIANAITFFRAYLCHDADHQNANINAPNRPRTYKHLCNSSGSIIQSRLDFALQRNTWKIYVKYSTTAINFIVQLLAMMTASKRKHLSAQSAVDPVNFKAGGKSQTTLAENCRDYAYFLMCFCVRNFCRKFQYTASYENTTGIHFIFSGFSGSRCSRQSCIST